MIIASSHINNRNRNVSFKQAMVNICALGDIHGKGEALGDIYTNIQISPDNVFVDKDSPSTLNTMAIVGDYFFNPSKKGYLLSDEVTSGEVQLTFLNKFISSLKGIIPGVQAYFTVGNHDLDGGDEVLFNLLKNADMQTVITNVDFDKSKEINKLSSKEKNILVTKSKILSVQDSENPKLQHKVLLLGLSITGLDYYFPRSSSESGITHNFSVLDRFNHLEKFTEEEELKNTYKELNKIIKSFKKESPDSPVVIMSHTGDAIAKHVAKNVNVDYILSGHDHIDTPDETYEPIPGKKTKIISLSQDGKLFKALHLHFNDEGKVDTEWVDTIFSNKLSGLVHNPINELKHELLSLDSTPLLKLYPQGAILDKNNVRYGNSKLANTLTDMILEQIQEKDPEVLAFGVASSVFRRGLKDGSSNLDIINVLSGSIESQSLIKIGHLSGYQFAEFILENVAQNMQQPNNLPIVQWSGVKIDKAELINIIDSELNLDGSEDLLSGAITRNKIIKEHFDEISKFIKVKNKNGKYQPLAMEEFYKIALPNKFFIRTKIGSIKNKSVEFYKPEFGDITLNELMQEYLFKNNYNVKVSDDIRIIE